MEFFRIQRDIPFMRFALTFNVISLVTFVLAVVFLVARGLNLGVDFRGGTLIEVTYEHAVDFNRLRGAIDKLNLGEYAAQSFGSGPVRGFAVVHCLGIMTSMFSAVFVSRGIVILIYGGRKHLAKISIGQVWRPEPAPGVPAK